MTENPQEQDATAVELSCTEIWERGLLPEMPADARQQLTEYLKTPPLPPREKAKAGKAHDSSKENEVAREQLVAQPEPRLSDQQLQRDLERSMKALFPRDGGSK